MSAQVPSGMAIKCLRRGGWMCDLAKLERTIPPRAFRWLASATTTCWLWRTGNQPVHRGSFDRLLVAQSRSEPLSAAHGRSPSSAPYDRR